MASLFKLGGLWACDVYGYGRIRLGKLKGAAQENYRFIELIEQSKRAGVDLNPIAVDWLRNTSPVLRKRLAHLGLIAKREGKTVGDILKAFRAQPGKASSVRIRNNAADKLESYFKPSTPLIDVKPADAQGYRNWLGSEGKTVAKGKDPAGLNPASIARQVKWARTVFGLAVKWGWIADNPFSGIKTGSMVNAKRSFYVSPEITDKVMAETPTAKERLLFALGRWGGLRMPSELIGFKWSMIDWGRWSMTFLSPKTEAHEGQGQRTCPIFKELQPYFIAMREEAERAKPGKESDFVFAELRATDSPRNIVAGIIERAIKRAGLEAWPKLLNNLRATRATEVDKAFGSKCESEWIGHGADMALKHYLMTTNDDWEKATGVRSENTTIQLAY